MLGQNVSFMVPEQNQKLFWKWHKKWSKNPTGRSLSVIGLVILSHATVYGHVWWCRYVYGGVWWCMVVYIWYIFAGVVWCIAPVEPAWIEELT